MKKIFSIAILMSILVFGENSIIDAVKRVEQARNKTIMHLQNSISLQNSNLKDPRAGTIAHIVEINELGKSARIIADVEMARSRAMRLIALAVDMIQSAPKEQRAQVSDDAMKIIADAIASVEISKERAKQYMIDAAKRVAEAREHAHGRLSHPKAALIIAKNDAAVKIAKAVSGAQIAKAVDKVETARATIRDISSLEIDEKTRAHIAKIEAQAAANISSYLSFIETTKANMMAKIAKEVAKVEIAKVQAGIVQKEIKSHYPQIFIKATKK